MLPGQKWHVHDPDRPHPHVVTPGKEPGAAPSDAIVLFDGKDLSKWEQHGRGADSGKLVDAQWKVENGYFEVVPGTGDLSRARSSATASFTSSGPSRPTSKAPARRAAIAACCS